MSATNGVIFPPQHRQRTELSTRQQRKAQQEVQEEGCQLLKFVNQRMVKNVWTPFAIPVATTGGEGDELLDSAGDTGSSPFVQEYQTNLQRYPGYHMFVPRPTVVSIPVPVAIEDGGKGYATDPEFEVVDTVTSSNPAPIYSIQSMATGCKTHGPFKCSCKFVQTLSSHLVALHNEFSDHLDLTAGRASVMIGRKRGGGGGGAGGQDYYDDEEDSYGRDDEYGQPEDYDGAPQTDSKPPKVIEVKSQFIDDLASLTTSPTELAKGTPWGQAGPGATMSNNPRDRMRAAMFNYLRHESCNSDSVIVLCPEIKYWCAVIASPDLPIDTQRRVIGPFPLTSVDKLASMKKAAEAATDLKMTFPECVECRYKGVQLSRCFNCSKQVCHTCAMSCDTCGRKRSFCPHCIIIKRVRLEHPSGGPVSESVPDQHICQRCA